MSSFCSWLSFWWMLMIAGLWHVCQFFLLLSPLCCICIPLFLRLIGVNRPWRDGWMTGWMDGWMTRQMDEMMLHDVFYYTSLNLVPNAQVCVYLTVHITKLQLHNTFPKPFYIWYSTCIHGTLAVENLDVCIACDLWNSNIQLTMGIDWRREIYPHVV